MGLVQKGEAVRLNLKTRLFMERFRDKARKRIFRVAADMARASQEYALGHLIYDPFSKHVAKLTAFPAVHHAESFKPFSKYSEKGFYAGFMSTSGRAWWLETGTVRMGARPHMKPAFDLYREDVVGCLENLMEGEVLE